MYYSNTIIILKIITCIISEWIVYYTFFLTFAMYTLSDITNMNKNFKCSFTNIKETIPVKCKLQKFDK